MPTIVRNPGAARSFIEALVSRGRYAFPLEDFLEASGLTPEAASRQLLRANAIPIHRRSTFYLIVTQEHAAEGAPPVTWWLDDYFTWLDTPYYIGLLSAAAEHGASHQALQTVQIVVEEPRRNFRVGSTRIRFTKKKRAGETPTMTPRGARAPIRFSTPEATMLDLIFYSDKVGGMSRVIETIADMAPILSSRRLVQALEQDIETTVLQRAGFILQHVGRRRLSMFVSRALEGHRLEKTPLMTTSPSQGHRIKPNEWKIIGMMGSESRT